MKNVVVVGGGTGVFTVLSGLKTFPYTLTAIVSMADDGGSTGVLREEFGVLPPGDIRRALVALSGSDDKIMSELFNYRFNEGSTLKGHSLGNLLLTALERITGSFNNAVKEAVKILNVEGNVIPVTLDNTRLCAELEDGKVIYGEANIDVPKHNGDLKIKRVFLEPKVKANPEALEAIVNADVVILGPGDVYTSILPNLAVIGVVDALKKTRGKVVYIVNIMTKYGETNHFKASDFFRVMQEQVGEDIIDYVVVNTQIPKNGVLTRYEEEKDEPVIFDKQNFNGKAKIVTGNFLRKGQFLRHDPAKLAKTLSGIIN